MKKTDPIITVPVGRPLRQVLDLCYTARRPPLLVGGTGVGKSTILEGFARSRGIDFISRDLSIMEPPDLVGLPKLEGDRTRFLPPDFLPARGKGLIIFEELNRAPAYMRAPCLQLLTDRSLNDYRLPDGWLPGAAINPADEGYEVADLDMAMLCRFVIIHAEADRAEWLLWAREEKVHPLVIAYVESDASVFDAAISNPRSWEYVSDLLKAAHDLKTSQRLLQAALAGCVGHERAMAFCRFLEDPVKPLNAQEVLLAYRTHRSALMSWIKGGKLDLVEGTLLNLQKMLQSNTDFDGVHDDENAWRNLGRFLADLPGDLRSQAETFFDEHGYPKPENAKARRTT